jgi:hypothetical protein
VPCCTDILSSGPAGTAGFTSSVPGSFNTRACVPLFAVPWQKKHVMPGPPASSRRRWVVFLSVMEVARHLELPHIFAEKQEGKLTMRRFSVDPGQTYLVAEDVVTTGSAVREVVELVRGAGAEVATVACLVDRSGTNKPDFGAPFTSLLEIEAESFAPDELPEDLLAIEAVKPGSK